MSERFPLGELDQKITEMWAWVGHAGDGEGLPAFVAYNGGERTLMPMCGADRYRVESMRKFAQETADRTGRPIELRRFTTMQTVEMVQPKSKASE